MRGKGLPAAMVAMAIGAVMSASCTVAPSEPTPTLAPTPTPTPTPTLAPRLVFEPAGPGDVATLARAFVAAARA